jgi:two-component system CheB/CheR fusion protein
MAAPSPAVEEFPIVGVGASAGGLEAFSQLLAHLPGDTGMAFVLVQHLDPTHPSMLTPALARATKMVVTEARNGTRVEPDHVYVIPPNADLAIGNRVLTLSPRKEGPRPHMSIDFFFRTLADEEGSRAIGVLLSGTGSDGTDGLHAIKAEGGITLAQAPRSARFAGMPEHAIGAGVVDRFLPVAGIADELARLSRHPYVANLGNGQVAEDAESRDASPFQEILALVRGATGVDFTGYKLSTVKRRLARRMALHKIESFGEYVQLLRKDPEEAPALCGDILIHVTGFFRDPQVFEVLAKKVFPEIIQRHRDGSPIRIWVPGCSTGEEVYSITMSLLETLGDSAGQASIQIFGSDIGAQAIERARAGIYSETVARQFGPERLERFLLPVEGGYRIAKPVRDLCVFVKHDLTRDPPFAKLDLVSCRNVLIYFDPDLQKRVLPLFHYCLNPGGFLLLGRSETLGGFRELFSEVDKTSQVFEKKGASVVPRMIAGQRRGVAVELRAGAPPGAAEVPGAFAAQRRVDDLLLARYAPAAALVNENMEVVLVRGRVGRYLELAPGRPDLNLLKLARDGLVADLRAMLQKAAKERRAVRRKGGVVRQDGRTAQVDLEVVPVAGPLHGERLFLVLFEEPTPSPVPSAARPGSRQKRPVPDGEVTRLREELAVTKDYLESLAEEQRRMNDELTSSNEELLSSNEELQSTNEELETAKEELQSTNEELTTVNDELQNRNQELNLVNSDLVNLLASIDIPIVILGADRRVRRFTPPARTLLNLLPSDVGRLVDEIKPNIVVEDLDERISQVIETHAMTEWEVRDRKGRWYRMQIRPYLSLDNRPDGAVLSFVDIDFLKHAVSDAERARDYLTGVVETVAVPLVVLDPELKVVSANGAFRHTFGISPPEPEAMGFLEIGGGMWAVPTLRPKLEALVSKNADFAMEVEVVAPSGQRKTVSLAGSAVRSVGAPMILLTLMDVTERAALLAAAREARSEAERANRGKDLFLAMLSHELRTPLAAIVLRASMLRSGEVDASRAKAVGEAIDRSAKAQARLIDDLLDTSSIIAGKMHLDRQGVDLAAVVRAALEAVRPVAETKSIEIKADLDASAGTVSGDPARLQQVVWNLLSNALKFTPSGGQVSVAVACSADQAQIRVSDTGKGIPEEFLPHVFDRFMQVDSSRTRYHGGLGLGLAIVRDLVRLHGGTVHADSPGEGRGATFTVTLPLDAVPLDASPAASDVHRAQQADEASTDRRRRTRPLAGLRVLVVDDDDDTRNALAESLRARGAEIRTGASAAEAMQALEDLWPHVLLCDVAMPGEDGYSLIRRVRALEPDRGGRIPAAALTALAGREERERALAAGFQMHIAKPMTLNGICAAIAELAGRPAAEDPARD